MTAPDQKGGRRESFDWLVNQRFEPVALARQIVPPRRRPTTTVPGLDSAAADRVKRQIYAEVGLDDMVDLATAEMRQRPTPHIVEQDARLNRVVEIYTRWLPLIYRRLASKFDYSIHTFNKASRLGWPDFNRPLLKQEVVMAAYEESKTDPSGFLKGAFIIMNVRLQPEPTTKAREFQFLADDATPYLRTVTGDDRKVRVPWSDRPAFSMRTRLVFNYPLPNLICQCVDTTLNGMIGSTPVCKHNMYSVAKANKVRPFVLAIDVRHMERTTATIIPARTRFVGGLYQAYHEAMALCPYLVPSDTWKSFHLVGQPESGGIVQFGSGHSAVAPSQKELLLALYCEYYTTALGYSVEDALTYVLAGEGPDLCIFNFGDDNLVSAFSSGPLDHLLAWLAEMLPVEAETPPKFLGFIWKQDRRRFELDSRSYALRTYNHERAPMGAFRRFPYFGWVEKRKTYMEYGDQAVLKPLFLLEDSLLQGEGLSWATVLERARLEAKQLGAEALSPDALWGKHYLMTPEQLLSTGDYDGLTLEQSRELFDQLVAGGEFAKLVGI